MHLPLCTYAIARRYLQETIYPHYLTNGGGLHRNGYKHFQIVFALNDEFLIDV
jgi:hypothetical protein